MTTAKENVGGGSLVAAGMVMMNAAAYLFTVAAARILAPQEFGAVTALLGILLVGNVAALGLQASTARRLALLRDRTADVVSTTVSVTAVAALAVGVAVAASTVVLTPMLRLDSHLPVVLCGLALVPMTIVGAQFGIAQGSERWQLLAVIYAFAGIGRVLGGASALLISPTATSGMLGVAVGAWLPVLIGLRLLRGSDPLHTSGHRRSFLREAVLGSHALLAYFVLSNVDALVARNILDAHDSGLYASGLVLAKAALFMPQFVSVVLYPALARDHTSRSRRLAVSLVAGLGALAVAATALLPQVALVLVGGEQYAEVAGRLWLFALAGSLLAIVHVLVFDALARHAHGVVVLVWSAVAAVLVAAYTIDVHVTGLVSIVASVAAVLAVVVWLVPGESTADTTDPAPFRG
ncbi:polysaccharide biosynthesis protein [Aeromicrobium sp. CTD01-1L150]|uniref:polysaccharide biosynthesis protein n=1 Tax=Aeromicrobium sp. CTD01-1L150 TaxID=3341830 RepID=UPI0035C04F13